MTDEKQPRLTRISSLKKRIVTLQQYIERADLLTGPILNANAHLFINYSSNSNREVRSTLRPLIAGFTILSVCSLTVHHFCVLRWESELEKSMRQLEALRENKPAQNQPYSPNFSFQPELETREESIPYAPLAEEPAVGESAAEEHDEEKGARKTQIS